MKKFTISSVFLICVGFSNLLAQDFIKIDASFYSVSLDEIRMIDIYLPGDYFIDTVNYACIYYLHGGGANQNEGNTSAMWYYNLHAEDTTINSPPAIFVCPDGSCGPYMGSMWSNSELYGPFEDYFIQDVIGFVESNFRAISDKNFRSLVGWSMGGIGAANFSTKYPEFFRACVPCTGGLAMIDTALNSWKSSCYAENGSYNLSYSGSGFNTQVMFTCAGAWSPNIEIEPYHVEIPFDTMGNWVDSILHKWYEVDFSRRVKNLPDENELSWFLVCGTQDELCTYPTHLAFIDSLDAHGIGYNYNFFDGGHEFDISSWMLVIPWLDSIIDQHYPYSPSGIETRNQKFKTLKIYPNPFNNEFSIQFELREKANTDIEIWNNAGQKIKSFSEEVLQAGHHQLKIDASRIPAGVYFCKLKIGKDVVMRKIIKATYQ